MQAGRNCGPALSGCAYEGSIWVLLMFSSGVATVVMVVGGRTDWMGCDGPDVSGSWLDSGLVWRRCRLAWHGSLAYGVHGSAPQTAVRSARHDTTGRGWARRRPLLDKHGEDGETRRANSDATARGAAARLLFGGELKAPSSRLLFCLARLRVLQREHDEDSHVMCSGNQINFLLRTGATSRMQPNGNRQGEEFRGRADRG